MKKLNKKQKTVLFIICIIAILIISGILAYLTDTDIATNTFTIGKVDIELHEDAWDEALEETQENDPTATIPEIAQKIVPNKQITKDPTVKNVGQTDAYVYLKVTIPKANVVLDEPGATSSDQPLFTYQYDLDGWVEIFKDEDGDAVTSGGVNNYYDETSDSYIHVYYYKNDTTENKLTPGATTSVLFENSKVRFANLKSTTQGIDLTQTIKVEAYAIQTTGYTGGVLASEWVTNGFPAVDENTNTNTNTNNNT